MNLSVYVILFLCIISSCWAEFSPLIEIEQGVLRGVLKKDIRGGDFYSFLSVPYARKPIGNLRFMLPVIGDKWDGIFNATEDMPMCMQQDWSGKIVGQEDCLYLNIHTPELVTKALKPVMVFIHGGGFTEGHGRYELHGPEFLMPEGVVLVTINYRLGLFGFLNFENSKVGVFGNMGLKDQHMALRWVQKNIEKFGGDPTCVTIFGESAGAASVHFHMLSPMSQGLFHRVIAHSGSALNPWATIGQKNTGVDAAKLLGYEDTSELKMLPFLQQASVEDIFKVQADANIIIPIHEPGIGAPIVENIKEYVSFLPENPTTIISSKKFKTVPFMLGFTDEEGIIWDVLSLIKNQEVRDIPPERTLPYHFNFTNEQAKVEMANKIQDFYYKENHSSGKLGRYKHGADAWLNRGVLKTAKAHAEIEHDKIYLYMLSADTELNYFKRLHPITAKVKGASHVDDLGYVFKTKFTPDIKPGSPEWNAMERVVKLWTNFSRYGNPTPNFEEFQITWKQFEKDALNYMNIGTVGLSMDAKPFHERMVFWDKLEEEYGGGKEKDRHIEL